MKLVGVIGHFSRNLIKAYVKATHRLFRKSSKLEPFDMKFLLVIEAAVSSRMIDACDQGSSCSICDQNMRPKNSSLGTFDLVAGLFAATV